MNKFLFLFLTITFLTNFAVYKKLDLTPVISYPEKNILKIFLVTSRAKKISKQNEKLNNFLEKNSRKIITLEELEKNGFNFKDVINLFENTEIPKRLISDNLRSFSLDVLGKILTDHEASRELKDLVRLNIKFEDFTKKSLEFEKDSFLKLFKDLTNTELSKLFQVLSPEEVKEFIEILPQEDKMTIDHLIRTGDIAEVPDNIKDILTIQPNFDGPQTQPDPITLQSELPPAELPSVIQEPVVEII